MECFQPELSFIRVLARLPKLKLFHDYMISPVKAELKIQIRALIKSQRGLKQSFEMVLYFALFDCEKVVR